MRHLYRRRQEKRRRARGGAEAGSPAARRSSGTPERSRDSRRASPTDPALTEAGARPASVLTARRAGLSGRVRLLPPSRRFACLEWRLAQPEQPRGPPRSSPEKAAGVVGAQRGLPGSRRANRPRPQPLPGRSEAGMGRPGTAAARRRSRTRLAPRSPSTSGGKLDVCARPGF